VSDVSRLKHLTIHEKSWSWSWCWKSLVHITGISSLHVLCASVTVQSLFHGKRSEISNPA